MWHYLRDDDPQGPVPEDAIRALIETGRITPTTLVWRAGLADWIEAASSDLKDLFAGTPTPPEPPFRSSAPVRTPSGVSAPLGVRPLGGLAGAVRGFAYLYMAISVAGVGSGILEYQFLQDAQSGVFLSQIELIDAAESNDLRQSVVGILSLIAFIVSGILILRWTYRASKNLHLAGARGMTIPPGWAVGWYFIPIMALWKPYQAMSQIAKASQDPRDPGSVRSTGPLGWWWLFWLVGTWLGSFSFTLLMQANDPPTFDMITTASVVGTLSYAVDIPAVLSLLAIISRATRAQDSRPYVADVFD